MKRNLISVLLIILLIGCHEDSKIQPADPETCASAPFTRLRELKDIDTYIVAKIYPTATEPYTSYYVQPPDVWGLSVGWKACNLPKRFEKHGLRVRINGYQLTFPGIESANMDGIPIELTHVEER